jgi:hypothetical protein
VDCLDVVAVRVEQVGRVVVGGVLADARRPVVPVAAFDPGPVEGDDRLAGPSEKGEMKRLSRRAFLAQAGRSELDQLGRLGS